MEQLRRDYVSAQLIEIGIVIQALQGTDYAVNYLASRNVSRDIIRRVLLCPEARRMHHHTDAGLQDKDQTS
jgi:hypothetical protein